MLIISILKLPINLLIEFLKWCDRLENKNKGYMKYLFIEFKNRFK